MQRRLMHLPWTRRRFWALAVVPALTIGVVFQLGIAGTATASTATASTATASTSPGSVAPKTTNELDCNGWSNAYSSVKQAERGLCTDPIQIRNGKASRFVDNGWYVGHDEPSVKFISSQPGSGNNMTYFMKLPVNPPRQPTASGSVTDYGELSIAPWFGLPICDPLSYPQNACKPDSDSNLGSISNPNDAGSAFLELQLYPPGFGSFVDSFSCSQNKWCGALTIDSLECSFNFATCNPNCEEPVNFSYVQKDGVPTGPPSPQLADVDTDLPNSQTLEMNGGDVLAISIFDPPQGLTTVITDLTTHQTGYMVASAQNGFMDTNIANCDGQPFTFHAEYNTAAQQNQVPWAALEGGVIMEQEVGHFETCNSLKYKDGYQVTDSNGESYSDPDVYQTCVGGSEGPKAVGEGPCSATTDLCQNSQTEGTTGPIACPTDNADSGQLCEYSDGYCFPAGSRPVTINGAATTETWPVAGCNADQYQNGDLDFDGISYQPHTWPNGTPNTPTAASYIGPFTGGRAYPTIQFETDIAGSEFQCDVSTGAGCDAPPLGSEFYPFWTMNDSQHLSPLPTGPGTCVWNFGDVLPNVTTQTFGKDAEYGTPDVARYGGTIISPVQPNPEFTGACRSV
jgi:hypothetical protein